MKARRDRTFFRDALAEAHRRATEDLLRADCDAKIFAAVAREDERLAKLQEELLKADVAARRSVARRLRSGWWAAVRAVAGTVYGGDELGREIEAVRKEWNALRDDAQVGKQRNTGVVQQGMVTGLIPVSVSELTVGIKNISFWGQVVQSPGLMDCVWGMLA